MRAVTGGALACRPAPAATRVGVAPLGRGKPGEDGTYQAPMIPITSVLAAPESFWYSLWSLIT